jgi:adenylylsulfate kinase
MSGGRVIWITGLSGAGKTTLARALLPLLPQPRLFLDGDALREALAPLAGGYGRADRLKLSLTYARICLLAAGQGQQVVCATISLFHEVHQWNRKNLPGYFEVFLDPPPETILARDYKKVYQKGDEAVMGRAMLPEFPLAPDLKLSDPNLSPAEAASLVWNKIGRLFSGRTGRGFDR